MSTMTGTHRALSALTIAVAADIYTTMWAMSQGATELNPLVAPYAATLWLFVTVKLAVLAMFAVPVLWLRVRSLTPVVWSVTFVIMAASVWNVTV